MRDEGLGHPREVPAHSRHDAIVLIWFAAAYALAVLVAHLQGDSGDAAFWEVQRATYTSVAAHVVPVEPPPLERGGLCSGECMNGAPDPFAARRIATPAGVQGAEPGQ
jgi:hypothetical protein